MRRLRSEGFTLVEILVVLIIVSVMSGVVLVSLPNLSQSDDFDAEVKRLRVILELAREEALIQSSELGFRLDRNSNGDFSGYSFYIYDDLNRTWTSYNEPPFKPRTLDEDIQLELEVEGEGFKLDDDDENLPPVMLLSSGEMTPFDLTIYNESDAQVILRSDGYTRISVVDEDER